MSSERKIVWTESFLNAESIRQAGLYVDLGANKLLDPRWKVADYMASLLELGSQPEAFKDRFDVPVLVDPRLPVDSLCKKVGIDYGLSDFSEWPEDPGRYQTPGEPYWTWTHNGLIYRGLSVGESRTGLAADERGATVYDGVAFYVAYVYGRLQRFYPVRLPGTRVGSYDSCYLMRNGARGRNSGVKLRSCWADQVGPDIGCMTCGREL